jgi:hypothetical protein
LALAARQVLAQMALQAMTPYLVRSLLLVVGVEQVRLVQMLTAEAVALAALAFVLVLLELATRHLQVRHKEAIAA